MGLRILVVDDASFIRDLIKKALRSRLPRSEVVEAADGRKAQHFLKTQKFDLILSDWEMPEVSGEELLQWVRSEAPDKDVPFVMITSRGEKQHVIKAVQAGVSEYLSKPFNNEELLQKVNKVLTKAGKLKGGKEITGSGEGGGPAGPFSSAEIFTRKADKAADTPPPAAVKEKPKMKGTAQVRFRDFNVKCMIKDISVQDMSGLIKREEGIPGLFQQAVVDILPKGQDASNIARLNAYVHGVSAVEKKMDAEFLSLVLRFVDDDEAKLAQLKSFIAGMD